MLDGKFGSLRDDLYIIIMRKCVGYWVYCMWFHPTCTCTCKVCVWELKKLSKWKEGASKSEQGNLSQKPSLLTLRLFNGQSLGFYQVSLV